MKKFDNKFIDINSFLEKSHKPDFDNILKVLKKEAPNRPTLFEFILNGDLVEAFTKHKTYEGTEEEISCKKLADTYYFCGYDYACMHGSYFSFKSATKHEAGKSTISLNQGFVITDRESFENYEWANPEDFDYSRIEMLSNYLPEGMKLIIYGPGGILENVIRLVGYENLCYMLYEDPELVEQIFKEVSERLLTYYDICAKHDCVGILMSNDDWGFNTQTMLSVDQMRKYVFPWHKKIAELAHSYNKPICLHSCGKFDAVVDDIAYDIKYDGRHSYEDNILPVEEAYKKYKDKFAILGGIDVDFLTRGTPEEIYNRSAKMLELAKTGYALGSGNSIASYIPIQNYLAMIAAAVFNEN